MVESGGRLVMLRSKLQKKFIRRWLSGPIRLLFPGKPLLSDLSTTSPECFNRLSISLICKQYTRLKRSARDKHSFLFAVMASDDISECSFLASSRYSNKWVTAVAYELNYTLWRCITRVDSSLNCKHYNKLPRIGTLAYIPWAPLK
jgi:hypothetical protein